MDAKRIAEAVGETFLAYLLAMAIQETRGAMRQDVDLRAHADDQDGPLEPGSAGGRQQTI